MLSFLQVVLHYYDLDIPDTIALTKILTIFQVPCRCTHWYLEHSQSTNDFFVLQGRGVAEFVGGAREDGLIPVNPSRFQVQVRVCEPKVQLLFVNQLMHGERKMHLNFMCQVLHVDQKYKYSIAVS
jgi:hypothetical protein